MNYAIHRISLDVSDDAPSQLTISAKKGDKAKRLIVTLLDDKKLYEISKGCHAIFVARKPNGDFIQHSCVIDEINNKIIYDFQSETVDTIGLYNCEISLYKQVEFANADGTTSYQSEELTTSNFSIIVHETVLSGYENDNESDKDILQNLIQNGNAMIDDLGAMEASVLKAVSDANTATGNANGAAQNANTIADTLNTKYVAGEFHGRSITDVSTKSVDEQVDYTHTYVDVTFSDGNNQELVFRAKNADLSNCVRTTGFEKQEVEGVVEYHPFEDGMPTNSRMGFTSYGLKMYSGVTGATTNINAATTYEESVVNIALPTKSGTIALTSDLGAILPKVTAADAGKFLRVDENGNWVVASVPNAEDMSV